MRYVGILRIADGAYYGCLCVSEFKVSSMVDAAVLCTGSVGVGLVA